MSTTDHDRAVTRGPGGAPAEGRAPGRRRRSIRATGRLTAWRTVDLLTVAFLGVAFGVAFFGWTFAYQAPSTALSALFPPLAGVVGAPWLMAGVVGGLVVRRPGAALLTEVVAALVEMLLVSSWGVGALVSGIVQGLGAEIGFLLLGYGGFGLLAAALSGALAGALESVWEWFSYWQDWAMDWKLVYLVVLAVSGAVIVGPLGWLLTRALARAGALTAFPAGQEARESRAV